MTMSCQKHMYRFVKAAVELLLPPRSLLLKDLGDYEAGVRLDRSMSRPPLSYRQIERRRPVRSSSNEMNYKQTTLTSILHNPSRMRR